MVQARKLYASRLKRAWKTGWLISAFLILVASFAIWVWPSFQVRTEGLANEPQALYLLSALAQSLAAVLSLVFAISLVVMQLSWQYSHSMLKRVLDPSTIAYVLFFILVIFLSLWYLGNPTETGVKVSLSLGIVAMLLLVPYLLRVRESLSAEHFLEVLKREASRDFQVQVKGARHRSYSKEPEAIADIENIIWTAFGIKDYETFGKGVESLADTACMATEGTMGDVGVGIVARLRTIGLMTIDDPRAPRLVVQALREACYRGGDALVKAVFEDVNALVKVAVEKRLEDVVCDIASFIGGHSSLAAEIYLGDLMEEPQEKPQKGPQEDLWRASRELVNIGTEAIEKVLARAAKVATSELGRLGNAAIELGYFDPSDENLADWIIESIANLGMKAIERGQESSVRAAATSLWRIGSAAVMKEEDIQTAALEEGKPAPKEELYVKSVLAMSLRRLETRYQTEETEETGEDLVNSAYLQLEYELEEDPLGDSDEYELRREKGWPMDWSKFPSLRRLKVLREFERYYRQSDQRHRA
jgi:hypothetical protein